VFDDDGLDQLASVKRTTALCMRWPDQLSTLEARAAELDRQATALEGAVRAANANRLRHDATLSDIPAKVVALQKELNDLSTDVKRLPQELEKERRAVVALRRQDEQFLRTRLRPVAIEPELLNAYLLRQEASQCMEQLTGWLRCIRQVVPTTPATRQRPLRGEDVLFAGLRPRPNVLIRKLEMQGEAQVIGQPVAFRGLIQNLTPSAAIHSEPIQCRFSASGRTPMEVRFSVDRTGGIARDELFIDCHDLSLIEQLLGESDQLQLKLAPCTATLSVSMNATGDGLTGDIQLVHKDVRITPAIAGELGDLTISSPLNDTLGEIRSLATRISVQGTIDEPACKLWSNLGPAVAEALDRALERHADERIREILVEARRHVDERLAGLERRVADHQSKFASRFATMPGRIDAIAHHQVRGERISVEQLGRRLPNNSLFR
jgi:uncharacterized protein (TIGR03545 family)